MISVAEQLYLSRYPVEGTSWHGRTVLSQISLRIRKVSHESWLPIYFDMSAAFCWTQAHFSLT